MAGLAAGLGAGGRSQQLDAVVGELAAPGLAAPEPAAASAPTQAKPGIRAAPAVRALAQAGRIDPTQIWQRLQDFFRDGHIALALQFAPELPIGAWQGIDRAARDPMSLVLRALHHLGSKG